jgi:hypothetical protein
LNPWTLNATDEELKPLELKNPANRKSIMNRIFTLTTICLFALSVTAQDDCGTALNITAGLHTVAAVDGSEIPSPVCTSGGDNASNGEWYRYTPTADYDVTISTDLEQNAGVDTRVNIYVGGCGSLVCIAGDDDSGDVYLSIAEFGADAGESYYIAFDDNWDDSGFDFTLTENVPTPTVFDYDPQVMSTSGNSLAVVDMNGDFLDDLVAVSADLINIHFQQPGGGFIEQDFVTTTADHTASWSLAAGDIDANGYTDLLYAGGSGVTFMMANDDGTGYEEVSFSEYVFCQRSNFVDINNDGNLDAFVCHDVQPNVYFLNDGEGNLTFYQGGLGDTPDGGNYGSVWIDYDNDHDIDMFIAKCRGGDSPANINQMHRNNGDGTFTEVAEGLGLADNVQTWSSAWGDFDNDGDMDVLVGASSTANGSHKLIRNDGNDVFVDVTAGSGYDTFGPTGIEHCTYDFDNDGYLDVMGAGGEIMRNNGDWTFSPVSVGPNNGSVGDLNNDGFLDIVNGSTIYFHETNDNNWIKVNTIGTESNINGIGARVEIESSMGRHIRDIRSGEGFRYMSSLTAHIGLGQVEEIEQMTIFWPSGVVDVFSDVPINTTINVTEGGALGIIEASEDIYSIYPNPAAEWLNVELKGDVNPMRYDVYDARGQTVMSAAWDNNRIDVSKLPTGYYILALEVDGNLFQQSFTKK